jgi:hypothetical protein
MLFKSPVSKILLLTLAILLAYSTFLQTARVRVDVGESNFQSNLIRLQAFLFEPPPRAVLIGSSLTGRLVPDYFTGTAFDSIANLGLDGSGPGVGLKLVCQRPVPLVVIEENLLLKPKDANDKELEEALQSFHFLLSKHARILRAESRPSAVLYSLMKSRITHRSEGSPAEPAALATSAALAKFETKETESVRSTVREDLKRLRATGCQIVLLRMPAGINSLPGSHPACVFADQLCQELNLCQINLVTELANRGHKMQYTDRVHLSTASARQASQVLAEVLASVSKQAGNGHLELETAKTFPIH